MFVWGSVKDKDWWFRVLGRGMQDEGIVFSEHAIEPLDPKPGMHRTIPCVSVPIQHFELSATLPVRG